MNNDTVKAAEDIPSVEECRKLQLVAMIAGTNELAAHELKLLLKINQPEVLGRCRSTA